LIQQNVIWHHTDPDTLVTHYEANAEAAYNLVRTGKILDTIHHNYGEEAKFLVHNILLNGHLKLSELMELGAQRPANGVTHAKAETNGAASETTSTAEEEPEHVQQTFDLIAHLIAVGILEPLNMRSLQPPEDVRAELDREIMKSYPSGLRGTKQKNEFNARSKEAWREVQDESKDLKARLERDYMNGPAIKRRKLANGAITNGFSAINRDDLIDVGRPSR
jgi:DNA-directed RNA polymerase III subunit RPC3